MGKIRSKKSRWRHRPQPTGIPSVREAEEMKEEEAKETPPPVLEKLSSLDAGEREWACRSLSHLVQDRKAGQFLLTRHRMLRRVLPLLLDREWAVREAAAGALRNLSTWEDEEVCGSLVKEDVMTVLSAMLKECVSQLQSLTSSKSAGQDGLSSPSPSPSSNPTPPLKGKGARGKGKSPVARVMTHQVMSVAEQGLHLLLNMSEWSDVVVEVANQEQLVLVLLYLLQPSLLTPHLVTVAATCLYTLTEDNPPSHHLLTSSPSHLSQLETLLSPSSQPASHMLIVSASIAGVFQHLLPTLPPSTHHHIPKLVLSVLMDVLGTDVSPLLHTLTSTPPPTPPQTEDAASVSPRKEGNTLLEDLENILSAQQVALEVIANLCYTESEVGGSDGGDWEDDGEEEEVIGGDMEEDTEEIPMDQEGGGEELPPTLTAVIRELGVVEMVWKRCAPPPTPSSLQACPAQETIIKSIHTVQSRAFAALQNLTSALPRETLSQAGGVATLWGQVIDLVTSGSVAVTSDVTGLLVVLARGLEEKETEGVTVAWAQLLARLCLEQEAEQQVRADTVVVMATLGRKILHLPPLTGGPLLQVLGAGLRDCVSRDPSLWVVALALDGLFDVFGDDNCPLAVFTSLQIMPVLKNAASFFKARLRVEKSTLGTHSAVVHSARENLPRFIEYMESRTRAS